MTWFFWPMGLTQQGPTLAYGALMIIVRKLSSCFSSNAGVNMVAGLSDYTCTVSENKEIPMQCNANFDNCKSDNFQMKNSDIFIIFAQNTDLI